MLLAVAVLFYFHTLQTLHVKMYYTYVKLSQITSKFRLVAMFLLAEKPTAFRIDNLQVQTQRVSVLQLCCTTVTVIKHIDKIQSGYGKIITITVSHVRSVKTELEN